MKTFMNALNKLEKLSFWSPDARTWTIAQWEALRTLLIDNGIELPEKELPSLTGIVQLGEFNFSRAYSTRLTKLIM